MTGPAGGKVVAMTDRPIGTWTLVSAVREEIPSGEKSDRETRHLGGGGCG